VFLLSDTQIIDERFLEDINNILNSGEVPNLFETDELNAIKDAISVVLKEKNVPITPANCWMEFVARVR
jgi:dynein heavy chain